MIRLLAVTGNLAQWIRYNSVYSRVEITMRILRVFGTITLALTALGAAQVFSSYSNVKPLLDSLG